VAEESSRSPPTGKGVCWHCWVEPSSRSAARKVLITPYVGRARRIAVPRCRRCFSEGSGSSRWMRYPPISKLLEKGWYIRDFGIERNDWEKIDRKARSERGHRYY
jgi:hypothetical protein